jgi:predicted secreted protein
MGLSGIPPAVVGGIVSIVVVVCVVTVATLTYPCRCPLLYRNRHTKTKQRYGRPECREFVLERVVQPVGEEEPTALIQI